MYQLHFIHCATVNEMLDSPEAVRLVHHPSHTKLVDAMLTLKYHMTRLFFIVDGYISD